MHPNDGRIYFAVLSGVVVLLAVVILITITVVAYQRKRWAFHRRNIAVQISYLDAEKARIAADLHDDIGSALSGIKMHLQHLKPSQPEIAHTIDFSNVQIDGMLRRLRMIAHNMIPDILLQGGLDKAVRELFTIMIDPAKMTIDYQYNVPHLKKEKAVHIYRITQEVLNNTLRHADASNVSVSILQFQRIIHFQFTDNGKGFNKTLLGRELNSFGLKNIMTRVDLLEAKIYVDTAPGKGVAYLIKIPA